MHTKSVFQTIKQHFLLPNEYVCINQIPVLTGIKVLFRSDQQTMDVTKSHLFLGYMPVTIGLPKSINFDSTEICELLFYTSDKFCGSIKLKLSKTLHPSLNLFEGTGAQQRLLSVEQKLVHYVKGIRKQKDHPLYPKKGVYDQIRVAYSYPRKISILIPEKDKVLNVFPTDLHGNIETDNTYIISLREAGNACKQIMTSELITISDINSKAFREVYALGKNHMAEMQRIDHFSGTIIESNDSIPRLLYKDAVNYKILERLHDCNVGIHKLITFKILKTGDIQARTNILAHVHEYYALWRRRNGYKDELLFR
ncbi:MAG TPA: hypothetical protein PKM97_05860 [Bacteroidia bacterium]|nr:hypothetical protein [Bacteroidia bacterium]